MVVIVHDSKLHLGAEISTHALTAELGSQLILKRQLENTLVPTWL